MARDKNELDDDYLYKATPEPRKRPMGKPKFQDLPTFKEGSLRKVGAFIARAKRSFRID